MTRDTSGPDRFDELIEALNNSPDLLPPTHPNGPRSYKRYANTLPDSSGMSDEARRVHPEPYVTNPDPPTHVARLFAKPPSERGWEQRGLPMVPERGPYPIGVDRVTGQYVYPEPEVLDDHEDTRETDATFENETRPL